MIDLGLAKRYINPKTCEHISFKSGLSVTGTVRYVSKNAQSGYEQSRRDDIESLALMLVYFLKGSLPWQGLKFYDNKERDETILNLKINTEPDELCKNLPN